MPTNIANWCSLHVVGHSVDGESFNVGFNFIASAPITDTTPLAGLCDSFWSALGTQILAILPVGSGVDRVYARTHYNPPYLEGQASASFPQGGSDSNDALPNNTSEVLSWRTKFIGRKYRGRSFLPAASEPRTAGDRFNATYLSLVAAIATRVLTGFTGGSVTFIPGVPSRVGIFITPIISFVVDFFIEALRDRLPRHHRHKRRPTTGGG